MSPRNDATMFVEQTKISPCHVLHVVIWHTCILKPWELRPLATSLCYLSQFSVLDLLMYLISGMREGGCWIFYVLKALEHIGASFWCHSAATRTHWRQVSLARARGVWPGRTHSCCVALFRGFLFISTSLSGKWYFCTRLLNLILPYFISIIFYWFFLKKMIL